MPSRRLSLAVLTVLAVALVLSAAACAARSNRNAGLNSQLAPQLVLVTPPQGQISALSTMSLTVHTELPVAGGGLFLASGTAGNVKQVAALGVSMKTLEANTIAKVFYFVEKDAGAEAPLRAMGSVVYEDDRQILLAVPARSEADFLAATSTLGPHIELLTNDAVRLPTVRTASATITPAAPDPVIARLLESVTAGRLSDLMADLSGERSVIIGGKPLTLNTRFSFAKQIDSAIQYVTESFTRMGLRPQTVGWSYGRYSGKNIVVDVRGEVHPQRIWIVGAHLDNRSQTPYTRAPGADDNASGISAMLAIAEAVGQQRLRDTVRFIAFTGEEQGMWGSKSYAKSLEAAGIQIMGFINLDMLAYDGNDDRVIELHSGSRQGSVELAGAFDGANKRYETGLVIELKQATASRFSDHSPFWDTGYDAIMAIENYFVDERPADRNPWYHKTGDNLSIASMSYVERFTRAALATVLELAGPLHGSVPAATPITTATPTSSATPAAATSTPTAAPSPTPGTCRNLLLNGDMEASDGWSFGSTAQRPAYVSAPVVAGARSLRTGIIEPAADRKAHSSAYQRVTIPSGAAAATLTAKVWRGSADSSGDRQEVLLLNSHLGALRTIERGLVNDAGWQTVTYDLTPFAGQTVVVYLNTYNDGDGRRSWMYVDDVRVEVCTR